MSGNGFFKIQAVGKKVKTVQVTNSQEENLQKKMQIEVSICDRQWSGGAVVISAAPQRGGHAGSFQGQDGPFCEEPSRSLLMSARVSAKCSGFPQDQDVHSMVSMQSVPSTKCTDKDLDRALGRCSREDDVSNTENFPVGYISQPARPKRYFSVFIYTYKIKMLHL